MSNPVTTESLAPALTFEPEAHAYHLGERRLLSVTQVLGAVGLIEDEWYTEESRVRGRYIHRAIMFEEREGLEESSIDERLTGYVAAYRAFIRDVKPQRPCLLLETPLADPFLSFAGTPDQCWGGLFGRFGLVDIKSGGAADWHPLQTSAYQHLVGLNHPAWRGASRYALYLKANGLYRLVEHKDRNDFRIFTAALSVAQFQKAHQ